MAVGVFSAVDQFFMIGVKSRGQLRSQSPRSDALPCRGPHGTPKPRRVLEDLGQFSVTSSTLGDPTQGLVLLGPELSEATLAGGHGCTGDPRR